MPRVDRFQDFVGHIGRNVKARFDIKQRCYAILYQLPHDLKGSRIALALS